MEMIALVPLAFQNGPNGPPGSRQGPKHGRHTRDLFTQLPCTVTGWPFCSQTLETSADTGPPVSHSYSWFCPTRNGEEPCMAPGDQTTCRAERGPPRAMWSLSFCINSLGLLNKMSQTGQLKEQKCMASRCLEAGRPRSRCRQGGFPLSLRGGVRPRPLSLARRWLSWPCVLTSPSLCARLFYKATSHIGLGTRPSTPRPCSLIFTKYICSNPMSK